MTVKEYLSDGVEKATNGQLREAALSFCQAIKLDSTVEEAHQLLGEALLALHFWDDAEACFREAIKLKPAYPEACNHLGVVLKHKERLNEAEDCYRLAIQQKPDYYQAYHNLGNCLKYAGRFAEAEAAYCRALELKPDLLESRFSLASLYLLLGNYEKGWKLYDSRLVWKKKFRLNIPIWQGETLTGRRILLFYEQGFGDMIHFIRYAYQVAELAETTVWIQKPLERLLSRAQTAFVVCDGRDIDPQQFDFACSIFSLTARFSSSQAMNPERIPYLWAAADLSTKWREKIRGSAGGRRKVGVVWAGNPEHSDDHNRSIAFDLFSRLFAIEGITWISLQVGKNQQEQIAASGNILDFSDELVDFSETAGLIDNLDLVIAVDTAVAHLSGAMGKKTWLLLPFRPDWRWGLAGEQSSWYPTMRLFRQNKQGDWQDVLDRVVAALRDVVSTADCSKC